MRLIHALDAVLELAAALGQSLRNLVRTAEDIATDCRGKLPNLTESKFVGRHGESVPAQKRIECLQSYERGDGLGITHPAFIDAAHGRSYPKHIVMARSAYTAEPRYTYTSRSKDQRFQMRGNKLQYFLPNPGAGD